MFRKFSLIIILIFIISCQKSNDQNLEIQQEEKKSNKFRYIENSIQPGESIYQVIINAGISYKDCANYVYEMGQYVDYRSIQVGDSLILKMEKIVTTDSVAVLDSLNDSTFTTIHDTTEVLRQIRYKPNIITNHILDIYPDSIHYEKKLLPFERKERIVQGKLINNLSYSLTKMGFSGNERQQIIKPLEALVSFETDARKDDKFLFLIEEKFYKGEKLPFSKILYSTYTGKRVKQKEVFRFIDDREDSAINGMYNTKGKRLAIGSVRTPLNYMHVTSPFGWRIHPIAGTRKLHKGTDYRARSPKPVYAVAKGRIKRSGKNRGNGIEIRINHQSMMTHYAHLSKVYVRRGQKVRKGQKIGLTGNTGYSAAPHLHFGVKKNGRWVNPEKNLRMIGAINLKGKKYKKFKKQKENLLDKVNQLLSTKTENNI